MSIITIFLFFVYCYGLGFTVSSFVKNSENFFERNLMRIGFGLSLLPFLALVLNIIKIPADWKIILIISILYPIYFIFKNYSKLDFSRFTKIRITKTNLSILLMLLIFAGTFYVYGTGSFKYPYLEDEDPWGHSEGVKYFSIEKNVFKKTAEFVRYMNPYPPTYDILMGILHQTNDSVYWTLKFFNALIVSLSIIFFYFFVKEISNNRNKALFATFALASIPAFLSHFIWAIALTVSLFFVSFYAVERIKYDKKWWILSGLVMVTTLTSSPTHSTYFGLFFVLYILTKIILERKILFYHALAGLTAVFLSFIFWWIPMFVRYGFFGTLEGLGVGIGKSGLSAFSHAGTGDRVYTFQDFFIAQKQNMINNPIGIGIVLSILTVIALIFLFLKFKDLIKKENHWLVLALVWFVFTFYAVNAAKMPVKISPFRAWMLLAIPVCILSAEGAFNLMDSLKKFGIGKAIVLSLIIIGVFFTSTQQKIAVNTAIWPGGAFWNYVQDESGRVYSPELDGYVWMRDNIAPNTNVFGFIIDGPITGMDKFICYWCEDIREFKKTGINQSASEINSFLKARDYKYLIIGGQFAIEHGINETNAMVNRLVSSGLFKPAHQTSSFLLFELV